jgi:hypothetical protein
MGIVKIANIMKMASPQRSIVLISFVITSGLQIGIFEWAAVGKNSR